MRRRLLLSLVLAGFLATSAFPARAERAKEGNDARGPFDLASLEQTKRDGDRLRFVLTTHEGWKVGRVRSGGFAIRVDSDRDQDFDRFVLIEWKDTAGPGGSLKARVVLPTGETIAREPAHHRKPRRLSVWLDRNDLGIRPGMFQINAYSVFYADWCPEDGCRDEIPNKGRLRVAFGGRCEGREPDITGTAGDDHFRTKGRRVVVAGLGGDDVIRVEGGSVIACGGRGKDTLLGGAWRDVLLGGGGNDLVRTGGTSRRANRVEGGGGFDELYGDVGPDHMRGGQRGDNLRGGPGDDFLDGGGGKDFIRGGPGNDECRNGRALSGC